MEAPEKIYLYPSDRAGEEYDAEWEISPGGKGCVEYTRADTFIKKARKYFIKELPNFRSFMESGAEFIKNFESFIQGE